MVCGGVTYHVKVIKMKWLPHLLWLPHLHVNLLEIFLPRLYWYQVFIMVYMTYYIHFEITWDPCHLIGSHSCVLFTNCTILCSKWHLFASQWDSFTKKQQPIKFSGFFKEINQIAGKWETTLQLFTNHLSIMDQ